MANPIGGKALDHLGYEARNLRLQLVHPGRIDCLRLLHAMIEGAGTIKPVGQARMVPENAVTDDLRHGGIAPLGKIAQNLRTGRGMIDGLPCAVQAPLESRVVLPEIVKKPCNESRSLKPERASLLSCHPRNGDQMLFQGLPVGFARATTGMRIKIHHPSKSAGCMTEIKPSIS